MFNKLKSKITLTGLLLASQVAVVSAEHPASSATGWVKPVHVETGVDIPATINTIINWGFGLLIASAGLFILWAAFLYLTGGAVEDNVKKAKQFILYALIAIAVGFLSRGLVNIVQGFLTVKP